MRRKLLAFRPRKLLVLILILLVAAGVGAVINWDDKTVLKPEHPEYLSFGGNYVFTIPKNYNVDEQSVPGVPLIYQGREVRTLEDVYNVNGVSVQHITDFTGHGGKAFKNYVNKTLLPDLKKTHSTDDVELKFAQVNGWDVARVVIKKDGSQIRFIYLKNGQHPVAIISKEETEIFRKITQTIVDVEDSDLKDEQQQIKQSLTSIVSLIKNQKAQELYNGATEELKNKSTLSQLTVVLQAAASYTKEEVTISGVSYEPSKFVAGLSFASPIKNSQPVFGRMVLKKINSHWILSVLELQLPAKGSR